MSSVLNAEEALYNFLVDIMQDSNFNVFRGYVPKSKHKDRENSEELQNIYPCAVLKIISTNQVRENLDGYVCDLAFGILVGTKTEGYLENIKMSDFIKEKILDKLYDKTGFIIDQSRDFRVDFYNDEYEPFIFSKIEFTLMGTPVVPNINIIERFY